MFLSKKQLKIIDIFRKNIFLKETIAKISLAIKSNYPRTHDAVQELVKEKILSIETVGNSKVCSLEMNDKTISVISYLDEQLAFEKNIPNMNLLLKIPETTDDIIIITGSYAINEHKKGSDIDIAVITKNDAYAKLKLLETIVALCDPEIHITVFTFKDFKDMLLDKKENFGKEVFRKHLILRNAEKYYRIIREARNGINI